MIHFLKKSLKVLLPLVLLAYLLKTIALNLDEVKYLLQDFGLIPFIASFLIFLLVYPQSGYAWFLLVKTLGGKIPLRNAMHVWIISNTSRYIPGTVWQYIGRVELAQQFGVSRKEGIISVLYETLLIVVAGSLVSVFAWTKWGALNLKPYMVLLGMMIPLILLHPVITSKVLEVLARVTKKEKVLLIQIKPRSYLTLIPLFIVNFLLNGLGLFFLIYSLTGIFEPENILMLSGIYALSWLVGYFSIFAPGGLGVTEASLALLLGLQMPLPLASTIAIIYRFLLVIAELVMFTFALKYKK